MDTPITAERRRAMAQTASRLASDAANGVPGAAEKAREIMRQLAADRRLVVGE